ncbi:hypothetical protein CS8_096180 [Cupriavidus sp. 8B]
MSSRLTQSTDATAGSAIGWRGLVADWASDQQAFKVSWGKPHDVDLPGIRHLHLQLLPDWLHDGTDIDHANWPNNAHVFALQIGGAEVPLLLIAIMTFVVVTSSGTMAIAVNFAYRRERTKCVMPCSC